MRTRLLLTFAGMLGMMLLSYVYMHGQSLFTSHHLRVLSLLSASNEVESSLNANLLKSRDFLLLTYDPIVRDEVEMRRICREFGDPDLRATALVRPEVARAADAYCGAIEDTIRNVEEFKSKNSVLRNSIFYVQSLAATYRETPNHREELEAITEATLSYYLLPNESDRKLIESYLTKKGSPAFVASLKHVRTILAHKVEVNALVHNILEAPSQIRLDEFAAAYQAGSLKAEESARFYRSLLFWSSILLLLGVLYGIMRVYRSASRLADANERLESRVRERTRELSESQQLILQQQQSLLATTKMSALGEMAAGMAHEINNPLAIIQLNATQLTELLQEKPIREALALKMLGSIVSTTERIARIVQGLRTFSRDGNQDPYVHVGVSQLVNETVAFCRERFRHHGVELVIEVPDETLSFEGRATQISQVMLNLLVNAFDAVADCPRRRVQVSALAVEDRVEIRVTDSGAGIPPDVRRKIFEPFFTTKDIGKGTGMGLSISLGIVLAHGGRLRLDDTSVHTCFVVELPRSQAGRRAA